MKAREAESRPMLPPLRDVPWSFLMAFASLGLIYVLFRRRGDLFSGMGFGGKEVALLCLGSIAGWAVNLPVWISGETYLMVNVGGALVPVVLVAMWLRARQLRVLPTLVGVAVVAVVAANVVRFHPQLGIVAAFPYFFLPVAAALAYAGVVSFRKPLDGVPLAYASGSIGALVGADLFHIPEIHAYFVSAPRGTLISIGGAGVFDMVFLAGTSAMALHLALAVSFGARGRSQVAAETYPTPALSLRDSRRVAEHFRALPQPNTLERALAGLALSNLALRDGEYARSIRMSWLAVDSLLQSQAVLAYVANGVPPALRSDLDALQERYQRAKVAPPTLRDAGEANSAAKVLTTALAPRTGLRHQLEGVA